MLNHIFTLQYFLPSYWISIIIRVHYKNLIFFLFYCPLNLRKHTSKHKVIIHTYRSCPDASSHLPCSLYQNKCSLTRIILLILFTKFFAHINITLWSVLDSFRMLNLLQAIFIYHRILALLNNKLC